MLPTGVAVAPTPLVLASPPPPAAEIARLTVRRPDGSEVPLGRLRGARGTVVAFWASYCIPCRDELPALQRLAPVLGRQGVALVLADAGQDAATAAGFLRDNSVTLPYVLDPGQDTMGALGLPAVPSTAVLGPDGAVRDRLLGAADLGPLDGALAAMGISAQ